MTKGDVTATLVKNFSGASVVTALTTIVSTIGASSGAYFVCPCRNDQDCLLVGIQVS
jgi:hypothetical protein